MNRDCLLATVLGCVLLGGSLLTCTVTQAQHDQLRSRLSPELAQTYAGIVRERRNHYFQGLLLGVVLAVLVQRYEWFPTQTGFHRTTQFLAITMLTTVLYYSIRPKSAYMLDSLKTPEQTRAWLEVYRTMRSRYGWGMALGLLAAVPLARAYCLA